jgi:hypothetical protein
MKTLLKFYYRYWAIPRKIKVYKRLLKDPRWNRDPGNIRHFNHKISKLKFLSKVL